MFLFFKSHYLISHFAFAIAALVVLMAMTPPLEKKLKAQLLRRGLGALAVISFYLCATGLGLAIKMGAFAPMNLVHAGLGLCTYFLSVYFFFYPERVVSWHSVSKTLACVAATMIVGVASANGLNYFISPTNPVATIETAATREAGEVIEKKCMSCHNPTVHAGNLNFADHQALMNNYARFGGVKSLVFTRLNESVHSVKHMPHFEGELSGSEKLALRHWLDAMKSSIVGDPSLILANNTDPGLHLLGCS